MYVIYNTHRNQYVGSSPPWGICTCFHPHQTLRRMLVHRLKNRVEPKRREEVVNRILCTSCAKVYISQIGRTLEHRLKEYRKGTCVRGCELSSSSTACGGWRTWDRLEQCHSDRWASQFPQVCTGSMVHQIPWQPYEQRCRPFAQVYNPLTWYQNSTRWLSDIFWLLPPPIGFTTPYMA